MSSWWLAAIWGYVSFMLIAAFGAPFAFGGNDPMLAYVGGIVANGLSGAMTVGAGILAWRAAKGQINKQDEQIDLMREQLQLTQDEHVKRLHRFYKHAHAVVLSTFAELCEEEGNGERAMAAYNVPAPVPQQAILLEDITRINGILSHEDAWRCDFELSNAIRAADDHIRLFNTSVKIPNFFGATMHDYARRYHQQAFLAAKRVRLLLENIETHTKNLEQWSLD